MIMVNNMSIHRLTHVNAGRWCNIIVSGYLRLVGVDCLADEIKKTELTGLDAQAVAVAVQAFTKQQGYKFEGKPVYGDLKHYTVIVRHEGSEIEVVFGPDADAKGTMGGATDFGWEVHYFVSKDPVKVLREEFAR